METPHPAESAPSVTVELAFARMTIPLPVPGLVPFVAKVHKVKTRRGKEYTVLRLTLPKEVGEKIGVVGNDYMFALAQKAEWYHMIDWNEMAEAWGLLPPEMRSVLVHYGLVSVSGPVNTPSLSSPVISATQLASPATGMAGPQPSGT